MHLNIFQGHCRRRKIRCIASPNDTQGRCINCIRLKKECSFFPVDQASVDDSRGRQGSRASTGAKGNSTTSSPATSTSKPVEQPKKAKTSFIPPAKRPVPITVPTAGDATGTVGFQPQTIGLSLASSLFRSHINSYLQLPCHLQ